MQRRFPNLVTLRTLTGTHLTPLSQNIQWQTGDFFTPVDAIGQWFNQGMTRNLTKFKTRAYYLVKSNVSFLKFLLRNPTACFIKDLRQL